VLTPGFTTPSSSAPPPISNLPVRRLRIPLSALLLIWLGVPPAQAETIPTFKIHAQAANECIPTYGYSDAPGAEYITTAEPEELLALLVASGRTDVAVRDEGPIYPPIESTQRPPGASRAKRARRGTTVELTSIAKKTDLRAPNAATAVEIWNGSRWILFATTMLPIKYPVFEEPICPSAWWREGTILSTIFPGIGVRRGQRVRYYVAVPKHASPGYYRLRTNDDEEGIFRVS
jgi:hypothetical protein